MAKAPLLHGLVTASFGRRFEVEADGAVLACVTRGKRADLACGDRVEVGPTAPGQGVIEAVDPRSTLFYRSDAFRQKLIAANVSQIVIVLAAVPTFYEELLTRCLVAAEHEKVRAVIVLNKFDLAESARALESLALYRELGYPLLPLCAVEDVAPLVPWLQRHASVLVGQSGMGKSTIVNGLMPGARAATAEISAALDSGRHTTTHGRLYRLDADSALIDSPGLQEFGLRHLTLRDLEHGFREFRPSLGRCRFADCRHLVEPGCAVIAALERGEIHERRMKQYRKLVAESGAGGA